ncbi:acyl CoA:acetate/3-ketoacid CoA transferase [Alkalihalobacillus oceani]|uniref:Acyl CoA:acetate/3-ketoacid CoA transferase n=1 Tax=Halalkalibacter oceani TaxID=1653776 RepID=A0A9X2DUU6_9BACI|nr:CoA-transferase [Halalkalibacter oceani]MCM3716505.1 acyl CoA:acetate/3-ketoacid CoA transferase [Halalkalibacter oceani]
MKKVKIVSAAEAVNLVKNGDTVAVCGCENILTPETILSALGERYRKTGEPHNLTEVHPIIVGMQPNTGLEHFAQKGMVKRAVGSGFSYLKTSEYTSMLIENQFEAHVLPMGTIFQMLRDIAQGKSTTLTKAGIGTFVDPIQEGGRMNQKAEHSLASRVTINNELFLSYSLFPIDIAIIRGTTVDEYGNISLEDEPTSLGIKTLAMAAKNSGGKVIAQVRRMTREGTIHPRMVEVPGIFVDAVVIDPEQNISGGSSINPALTGETRLPENEIEKLPSGVRKVIVQRAAAEIENDQIINLGVGIPVDIPKILVEQGDRKNATFFPEHGSIGGIPGDRSIFGTNINPEAIIDSTQVFDFFLGGGLDITFLGVGQIDARGNVNVSKFNGIVPGCGGFIDITYKTPKVVFCGTFTAGGAEIEIGNGELTIKKEGKYKKFIESVEQITFNAEESFRRNQHVLYITERAVFSHDGKGLVLEEVAPGIDIQKDILDLIPFEVRMSNDIKKMDKKLFY